MRQFFNAGLFLKPINFVYWRVCVCSASRNCFFILLISFPDLNLCSKSACPVEEIKPKSTTTTTTPLHTTARAQQISLKQLCLFCVASALARKV